MTTALLASAIILLSLVVGWLLLVVGELKDQQRVLRHYLSKSFDHAAYFGETIKEHLEYHIRRKPR